MSKVIASITTSVDGYVTGPGDGPGCGLGVGGERLHYWVMGGPWTYETEHEPGQSDRYQTRSSSTAWSRVFGSGIRRARHVRSRPAPGTAPTRSATTLYVLTHRTEDRPDPTSGFVFVDGLDRAMELAKKDAGDKDVSIGGGADVIRQALAAGTSTNSPSPPLPVVLGGGKQLLGDSSKTSILRELSVHSSQYATHTTYAVKR